LGAPFCKYRMVCPRCTSYKMAEPNVHRHIFLLQNGSCRMVYESCSTCIRLHPLVRTGPLQNGRGREKAIKRIPQGSLDSRQQQQQQPTQPPTTSKSPGPTRPQSRVTSPLSFFSSILVIGFKARKWSCCQFCHQTIFHLYFLILSSMYQQLSHKKS
jgi:hypothetical protein